MTLFVDGVELSDALDAFTRHGRADDLAHFFHESQNLAAQAVAKPMKQFADDLLLMRIPNLLTESAPNLRNALAESLPALRQVFPPVAEELDIFKKQIDDLVPNGIKADPVSAPGLSAASILAQRLWDTGRYAELYNLLRESLLTAFSVVAVSGDKEQPGNPPFDKQRKEIEKKRNNLRPQGKPKENAAVTFIDPLPSRAHNIAKQFGEVAERRNDVAHCSMRSDPRKQEELRKALKSSLNDFRALVTSLSEPSCLVPRRRRR